MPEFIVHTPRSAPEPARATLQLAAERQGRVYNLIGQMAESPAVLEGYLALGAAFRNSSFTALEREIVMIAASAENDCHYCTSAHSTVARLEGLDSVALEAVRDDRPVRDNARLEALRQFTCLVVRERGFVSDADIARFRQAGFTSASVLEVILGVGMKTLSNYINHIAETPLDEPFQADAFTPRRHRLG